MHKYHKHHRHTHWLVTEHAEEGTAAELHPLRAISPQRNICECPQLISTLKVPRRSAPLNPAPAESLRRRRTVTHGHARSLPVMRVIVARYEGCRLCLQPCIVARASTTEPPRSHTLRSLRRRSDRHRHRPTTVLPHVLTELPLLTVHELTQP